MNITILDKTNVKYNGRYLQQHQTYSDIDDKTAQELIASGDAKQAGDNIAAVSYESEPKAEKTKSFNVKENGGYVAEAQLTEAQKQELETKGEATAPDGKKVKKDETPVTGKDNTQPKTQDEKVSETKQKVYDENGKELTEEEIAAKEKAAATGANDANPSVAEASKTGQEVK